MKLLEEVNVLRQGRETLITNNTKKEKLIRDLNDELRILADRDKMAQSNADQTAQDHIDLLQSRRENRNLKERLDEE